MAGQILPAVYCMTYELESVGLKSACVCDLRKITQTF